MIGRGRGRACGGTVNVNATDHVTGHVTGATGGIEMTAEVMVRMHTLLLCDIHT